MSASGDERLEDFRGLHERALRSPENFGAFLGEIHRFFYDLYEAAARADGNADTFEGSLRGLCLARGIPGWEEFLSPEQKGQFFKDAQDREVQRVIAFWAELDEPLGLW